MPSVHDWLNHLEFHSDTWELDHTLRTDEAHDSVFLCATKVSTAGLLAFVRLLPSCSPGLPSQTKHPRTGRGQSRRSCLCTCERRSGSRVTILATVMCEAATCTGVLGSKHQGAPRPRLLKLPKHLSRWLPRYVEEGVDLGCPNFDRPKMGWKVPYSHWWVYCCWLSCCGLRLHQQFPELFWTNSCIFRKCGTRCKLAEACIKSAMTSAFAASVHVHRL